jgi:hypothetical protein
MKQYLLFTFLLSVMLVPMASDLRSAEQMHNDQKMHMEHHKSGNHNQGNHAPMPHAMPGVRDTSLTKLSDGGKFKVSLASNLNPVAINKMHGWVVTVLDQTGKPVEGAKFNIHGGMPEHGHGLPTAPRVTKYLGAGQYLVEGMKFNMSGWWHLNFAIATGSQADNVTFSVVLK